ncbi:MAG TPA: IS66 family insertion sequence element accessory protein TnpB [Roseomonas sp.]|nr:IS66 family insertion sequence element accessory protein TnpB [Roseomonas sp.]
MLPSGAGMYLACGVTDMRKGFDGLAMLVQNPYDGSLFMFRTHPVTLSIIHISAAPYPSGDGRC